MGKAEDTKARVERAALTLFVARGVAETTTKEIAMAASIAEGTIYRYFPSKERLALDLFLRHHRALAEALGDAQRPAKGLRAKIDAIVGCYCDWADRDWTLFTYHLLNQHSFLIQSGERWARGDRPGDEGGRDPPAQRRPRRRFGDRRRTTGRHLQGLWSLHGRTLDPPPLLRRCGVGGTGDQGATEKRGGGIEWCIIDR